MRDFAHSRELPRMGKFLVRLLRKFIRIFPCPALPHNGIRFSHLIIQNLSPQAESPLSFAGISRQMKELNFSVPSASQW